MRSASVKRAALAALLCSGCGLFGSEVRAPSLAEVKLARNAAADEWALLGEASELYALRGPGALPELRELAAANPGSLRLKQLVQDVELDQDGPSKVWNRSILRHGEQPSAHNAYLAARVAPNRETMIQLTEMALTFDPDLVEARVFRLGLRARVGQPEVIEELVDLLHDHPGSAEGWRLLGELAPVYGRDDLKLAAAATEPWSPAEPLRRAKLLQATTIVEVGNPRGAIELLQTLPDDDREASLIRARALADLGQALEARKLLDALIEADPTDLQAQFNLGLLALDYLGNGQLASAQFETCNRLLAEGAELPFNRQLQIQLWLEQLDKDADPKPIRLGLDDE